VFLYNLYYKWGVFHQSHPRGVILHPVGFDAARNPAKLDGRYEYVLVDPNAYYWVLEAEACGKACRNLASHSWLGAAIPMPDDFDGDRATWLRENADDPPSYWPPKSPDTEEDLEKLVERCIDWQTSFGCTEYVLPSPLITDNPDDLDEHARWAMAGRAVAVRLGVHALQSVPILDLGLARHGERILDLVTARGDVGVYASIATSRNSDQVPDTKLFAKMLLDLSYYAGEQQNRSVVVNFADVFGLACVAVGAKAFASGYEAKTRRLSMSAFEDTEEGGGPYPRFFSLATTSRFLPTRDMNRIRDARLLWLFDRDETAAAGPLFAALKAGGGAEAVPQWREQRSNLSAARDHLVERLTAASAEARVATDLRARTAWALGWLQRAEQNVAYLKTRFDDDEPLEELGTHARLWRAAFETFGQEHGLL